MNQIIVELTEQARKVKQTGPEEWSDNQVLALVKLVVLECCSYINEVSAAEDDQLFAKEDYDMSLELKAYFEIKEDE